MATNIHPVIERLIISTSRGVQQTSFINELLSSGFTADKFYVPPMYNRRMWDREDPGVLVYGRKTKLAKSSWNGLKLRLVSLGFVVEETPNSVTLHPGLNVL